MSITERVKEILTKNNTSEKKNNEKRRVAEIFGESSKDVGRTVSGCFRKIKQVGYVSL